MASSNNVRHMKLKTDVLRLIDSPQYQVSDKLLPEPELSKTLGVSRSALRDVLDELHKEGYIQRIQGSGTIILKKRTRYVLHLSTLGSAAEVISGYDVMNTEYFKINEISAGNEYAQRLQVEPGEKLLNVERVRSLDGTPAIYTNNVLVKERIGYRENLYAEIANSLSSTMGWRVETSDAGVQFCPANETLSKRLGVIVGTPLLLVEETARQHGGLPLDYSYDYYVAELFDFQITRTRK